MAQSSESGIDQLSAPEPESLADDDPRAIGRYRLSGRLGAGAMGRVYLGETADGRRVAIKVVRAELADDTDFRRRFRQEVDAVRRVRGPHTAGLVDADPTATQPWLATEYLPGPSLDAVIRRVGGLPVAEVCRVVAGIARALAGIHAAGVVHRDLKPSNVVLTPDGPRVIDFGIARAADATALTATGIAIGTPSYMAPEQIEGGPVGPATDVFALGVLATFLATGKTPFGEGHSAAIMYRITHGRPNLNGVGDRLRPLVEECLNKNPTQRPAPEEIARRCHALSDPNPARPATRTASANATTPLTRPLTSQRAAPDRGAGPKPRRERRWTRRALAIAATIILVAGGLAVVLWPDGDSSGQPEISCEGKGQLTATGSTMAADAVRAVRAEYGKKCPGHGVNYTPAGFSDAITRFADMEADVVVTNYPMPDPEDDTAVFAQRGLEAAAQQRCETEGSDLRVLPMVFAPVAIVYNLPGKRTLVLDRWILAQIFGGYVADWNAPDMRALNRTGKLPGQSIEVVAASDRSSTTQTFQDYLTWAGWPPAADDTFTGAAQYPVKGDAAVANKVAEQPGTIGYVSWRTAVESGLSIATIAKRGDSSKPLAKNDELVSLSTRSVSLIVDEIDEYAQQPDSGAFYFTDVDAGYPLVHTGWAFFCTKYADPATAAAVRDFLTTTATYPSDKAEAAGFVSPTKRLREWLFPRIRDIS